MENKTTGMSTMLMRWAPGARLPRHEHVAIEQTFRA
jgi:anti-sigma factor ChrR (cupin superfamily)